MIRALGSPMTRIERLGLVIGLLLALVLMWPVRGHLTDDTFVHLQYARRLAAGQGLVFNRGERVYGCTSPLWVALLADGIALGLDGLVVARVLGLLATLASIALFMQLMRRTLETPELRALATVAWASHAWMLRWSVSGMETPLAVTLVLAGFVAFTEGRQVGSRPVRAGALWGLAALTRPEAAFLLVLWCALLIVDAHNREGLRRLVFGMLPPAAIYGAWLAFARLYFGTFWPHTLSANVIGDPLAIFWRQTKIIGATDGVLVGLLAVALILGGHRVWKSGRIAQELLPWAWVLGLPALYAARGVEVLSRYLLVVLPVLAWLAWRTAEAWWMGADSTRGRVRTIVAGTLTCVLIMIQNLTLYRTTVVPQVTSFTAGLNRGLVVWGRWFGTHTPPQTVIATPNIGAIGYWSGRRVLDVTGLVTPRMMPLLEREPVEDVVAELRFASFARPDYLIDRAERPDDLLHRSRYASCFVPIGHTSLPNLGIARPAPAFYTIYRVDWRDYDRITQRK
jgi:hypothetical protein